MPQRLHITKVISLSLILWFAREGSASAVSSADFQQLANAINGDGNVTLSFDGTVFFPTEIKIQKPVTINGSGHNVAFDGRGANRLFVVESGSLSLTKITLQNGAPANIGVGESAKGGAIYLKAGGIALEACTFLGNFVTGGPRTNYSTFPNCPPWGCLVFVPGGGGLGGALAAENGNAVVRHCLFERNIAIGGDGLVAQQPAYPVTSASVISGGETAGGAIWISNTVLRVESSIFNNNRAQAGSTYGGHARGGAISCFWNNYVLDQLDKHISDCLFSGNSVKGGFGGFGGAVSSDTVIFIERSSFITNTVTGGDDYIEPAYAHINGPYPGFGGGLFMGQGGAITNCVFLKNRAIGGDAHVGSASPYGEGGGAMNSVGTIIHCTFSDNRIEQGTPPWTNSVPKGAALFATDPNLSVGASIFSGPTNLPLVGGDLADLGFNISSDSTPQFKSGSSLTNTDALLVERPDSFARVWPATNSPAIDRVPIQLATVDIRGALRPASGSDVGGVEINGSTVLRYAKTNAALSLLTTLRDTVRILESTNSIYWQPATVTVSNRFDQWTFTTVVTGPSRYFKAISD